MSLLSFLFRTIRMLTNRIRPYFDKVSTIICFRVNDVAYHDFVTKGIPYVMVARGAKGMSIGTSFSMNNTISSNPVGISSPCIFFVDRGCSLSIGDYVGISQATLNAQADITIGNHVKIGGGTCIYTSDFHSLDARIRASHEDLMHRKTAPVIIGDDVFIGAKCIILKGVSIGAESIVGAGSVVTKDIPAKQIWAGNPAKFIRTID